MITLKNLRSLPINIFEEPIVDNSRAYVPFVWTEAFLADINNNPDYLLLHIWPMEKTALLGMLDKRLPHLEQGKQVIRNYGYEPFIRNIGGLAVVADEGVLNFSLFIPDQFEEKIVIPDAYQIMMDLIKEVFLDHYELIECFEIKNSYCPGAYDVSVNGKKFAGIAQRRVKKGIVVSIYLSVCGDQLLRGQMIADFYKAGLQEHVNDKYPTIDPACMANISDLLAMPLTVTEVIDRLKSTFNNIGFAVTERAPTEQQKELFEHFNNKRKALEKRKREKNE